MQVGRHHGIDGARLEDHAHGHRVHQFLVPGHVLVVVGDEGGDLVPEHHAVPLGVGLGDHGQVLARAGAGDVEGDAHDPLHAAAGEDGDLGGDLLGQAAVRAPALTGILALRVLAHDHPVQVARVHVAQGRGHAGQHPRRADVGVLVQALADLQPQPPERDMVGDVRVAHGAEIDRVRRAQPGQPVGRHEHAVPAVPVRAPVVMVHDDGEGAQLRHDRVQHLQPRADDLGADAVGGNGGDTVLLGHGSGSAIGRVRIETAHTPLARLAKTRAGRQSVRPGHDGQAPS